MKDIERLNKVYHQDLEGLKSLSAEKYGCSVAYFRRIVDNVPKNNIGVPKAIQAVKDASKEIFTKHKKINKYIQSI